MLDRAHSHYGAINQLAHSARDPSRGVDPWPDIRSTSLTDQEYRRTTAALREAGHLKPSHRFAAIALDEPTKADVLAWRPGRSPIPRRSLSVLWDREDNKTYEAVVDLADDMRREPTPSCPGSTCPT